MNFLSKFIPTFPSRGYGFGFGIPNTVKSASLANSGRVVKRRVLMTARLIVSPQDLKNSAKDKFSGPCRQRTVDHLGVKTAQILADERLGN